MPKRKIGSLAPLVRLVNHLVQYIDLPVKTGDSTIRVWSTTFLNPIYTLDPYEETGSGDLFALSWSASLQTLYIGCQNTSLQWFDFKTLEGTSSTNPGEAQPRPSTPGSGTATPSSSYQRKAHKFFDSYPLFERRPADIYANNTSASQNPAAETLPVPHLKIAAEQVSDWAHHGYIYCMALLEESEGNEVHLVTGSGDETVKVRRYGCGSHALINFSLSSSGIALLFYRDSSTHSRRIVALFMQWLLNTRPYLLDAKMVTSKCLTSRPKHS